MLAGGLVLGGVELFAHTFDTVKVVRDSGVAIAGRVCGGSHGSGRGKEGGIEEWEGKGVTACSARRGAG